MRDLDTLPTREPMRPARKPRHMRRPGPKRHERVVWTQTPEPRVPSDVWPSLRRW